MTKSEKKEQEKTLSTNKSEVQKNVNEKNENTPINDENPEEKKHKIFSEIQKRCFI